MSRGRKIKIILVVLDLLAASLLFVAVDGVRFGAADDLASVPWIYRLQDPELYQADLALGSSPSRYYHFYFYYLYLLSRLIPIEWVFILSILVSRLCLLVALRRLAKQVSGRQVPALGIALLMVVRSNQCLVAGYKLTSPFYSSHYTSIALVLLGITLFLDDRKWMTGSMLLLSALFNPRLGIIGAALVFFIWFWRTDRKRKAIAAIASAFGALLFLAFLVWYFSRPREGPTFDEIVRIWMFVRSPGHYLPAYWDKYMFLNLALVAIFMTFIWKTKPGQVSRAVCFAAFLGIAGIITGLVNNIFLIEPFLVLANPFQFGPFVLAFFYVFALATLVERIEKGYYVSTLLIFAVPDLQTRALLLLLAIVMDRWVSKVRFEKAWTRDVLVATVGICVIVAQHKMLEPGWLQMLYDPILEWRGYLLGVSFCTLLILQLLRRLTVRSFICSVMIGYLLVGYWMGTIAGISINPRIGTDWWPVCNFAAQETPVDSVFVIPPRRYDFQYYSRRSAFCTFKHLPSALERIPEWFKRLQVMQVIPSGLRPDEISTLVRLDYQAYDDLETEDFLNIKKQYNCVDFCVVGGQVNLSLPLVFENASYRVYRLEPYSPLEIELIRQQVETALEDALLDLRSASIVTEGGETYILAGTGGKMSIEGAVQVADGPWDGSSALVVDDQTRLSGPVTALDLSQGSLSVWARLTDRDKAYSPLVLANKSKGLYVVHKGVHGKLVVLYNDVRLGATSVAITDDQWHHYVLTWRNGEQQFYIDGLRQLSGRVPASVADTELFAIGWMGYKDGEEWEGLLANLTTFDRALSTAEVTTLYWESGSPPR